MNFPAKHPQLLRIMNKSMIWEESHKIKNKKEAEIEVIKFSLFKQQQLKRGAQCSLCRGLSWKGTLGEKWKVKFYILPWWSESEKEKSEDKW